MKTKQLLDIYTQLLTHLTEEQLLWDEPLCNHTTFRIGGPADLFIAPYTLAELCFVMQTLKGKDVPFYVLGGGSNILVLDGGIRGIVLSLHELKCHLTCTENGRIISGAGNLLGDVSRFARDSGLCGLEFAVGIPGTVGGAIYMNAGAYGGEMSQVVEWVRTVDKDGCMKEYTTAECMFMYRHSVFQDNEEIIAEVGFRLQVGNASEITMRMDDFTKKREEKQPLEWPSAGSTFKRPPGYFAGTLIDQTGLKGLTVGGAAISTKHAGFVINQNKATAKDVLALISEVQRRIKIEHGVELEPEVHIKGEM